MPSSMQIERTCTPLTNAHEICHKDEMTDRNPNNLSTDAIGTATPE